MSVLISLQSAKVCPTAETRGYPNPRSFLMFCDKRPRKEKASKFGFDTIVSIDSSVLVKFAEIGDWELINMVLTHREENLVFHADPLVRVTGAIPPKILRVTLDIHENVFQ